MCRRGRGAALRIGSAYRPELARPVVRNWLDDGPSESMRILRMYRCLQRENSIETSLDAADMNVRATTFVDYLSAMCQVESL
jgi:hypothetical protein